LFFEAVAAIELANQAINSIKELAGHVTSVGQMGKHLTNLADAHDEIQKRADEGDSQAFWHLEQIKEREREIKDLFIYAGRPGLWQDYQTFMKNRRELRRKAEEREKQKKLAKKRAIKNAILYSVTIILGALTVAGGIWLLLKIIEMGGK
tara:strand:+ start:912 stop:1361 length:450 start_codon:yes stop_codon:yes gene_type:complete